MATRNADVNLIVRAKTEGERAITTMSDAIAHLVSGAGSGSRELADFGRTVAALDKAAAGLSVAQDKVGASATKQAAAIHEATAGITEQQSRVETLRRGIGILATETDKAFVGPRRNGLADLLKLAKVELADAERQLTRYTGAYDRNLAALQTSRSGLLNLRQTTRDTAEAQAGAAAAVELTTQALSRQTAEAQRAAAAQSFYNAKGGPSGGPATANGASTDALIQHFQRLEAEASKVRAAIDPVGAAIERYEGRIKDVRAAALNGIIGSDEAIIRERQLRFELTQTIDTIAKGAARIREERRNSVTEYQALINELNGVTGKRATESGATFEALDADMRAREAAVRAREADQTRAAANAAGGVGNLAATDRANGTNRATFSALDARAAEEEAQAVRSAAFAYQQFETRVRAGVQAMQESEAAAQRDAATIAALEAKLDPLGTVQRRLNAELERYKGLAAEGKLSTEKLAQAEAHLAQEAKQAADAIKRQGGAGGAGEHFKASLFGLKPYELQNLSYQINDVVTGLASGQKIGQVVAQQGGQILQLFPRAGGAIVGALTNPAIIAFVATIGLIGLSIKAAADQAERLRTATSDLGRRANGGDYKAGDIANQERDLKHLGATAEQARAAINTFVDAGVPAASLALFSRTARDTAEVLGTDLPTAAQQVTTAFTGGYQAIAELDNRLNFLTRSQREQIRTLFENGHAQEAQTLALGIYSQKMDTAANNARGPWATANRDLSKSWHELLDSFANTRVIQVATGFINGLAGAVHGLSGVIDDIASGGGITEMVADLAEIKSIQEALRDPKNHAVKDDVYGGNLTPDKLRERLKARIANYNDAAREQKKPLLDDSGNPIKPAPGTTAATAGGRTTQGDTPIARERADRVVAINDEERLQQLRDAGQQRVLTAVERTERIRLAGAVAFRTEQDATLGALRRRQAGEHEIAAIARDTRTAQDRARSEANQRRTERNQTVQSFLQRISGPEGTGQNPLSSARGFGQLTAPTFISTYRSTGAGAGLSDAQVLARRDNPAIARQVATVLTQNNANLLEGMGKAVSLANLYTLHFLGTGTGSAVLRADPNTPVDQIVRRTDPRHAEGPRGVLQANRRYIYGENGRSRTAGQLVSFLGAQLGEGEGNDTGPNAGAAAGLRIAEEEARVAEEARRKQEELNLSIRHGNEDRQRTITALHEQEGKFGTGLIDVQRTQAGTQAVEELRQKVEDINRALPPGTPLVTTTPEQVAETQRLAEAVFNVQHARERLAALRDDTQRPIDELQEQKQQLQQQAEFLRSIGDNDGAERIEAQIRGMSGAISEAIDKAIQFYQSLDEAQRVSLGILDDRQLQIILDRLRQLKETTQEWGRIAGLSAQDVARAFASAAVNAFTNFINKVAAGKNVFHSFVDGIREFASAFIQSIAQMILQLLAFAAAVTILRALGVPVPANAFGGVPSHHTGGIAGQGTGQRRNVSPFLFAGAMRYHTGGIVGLAPDEQPAILRKGEEVLTESNPRHRNNQGASGTGGADRGTSVFNVFDPDHLSELLLRSPAGEKHVINLISDNKSAVKAALG